MWNVWVRREVRRRLTWGLLMERCNFEDTGVDRKIILKNMLKK
jgi:hypothetical protein